MAQQKAEVFLGKYTQNMELRYLVYFPEGYQQITFEQWPLLIFLHGSGERGNDLNRIKKHGPPKLLEEGKKLPFVVIAPQCPAGCWWDRNAILALLDHLKRNYRIDKTKIYLTGISMGGFATWDLACHSPHEFAAIAPVCGGGIPLWAQRSLGNMPIWAFHGLQDTVVPISQTQDMVNAIEAASGNIKHTYYPKLGHNCWDETYANDGLFEWFLSHKKLKK